MLGMPYKRLANPSSAERSANDQIMDIQVSVPVRPASKLASRLVAYKGHMTFGARRRIEGIGLEVGGDLRGLQNQLAVLQPKASDLLNLEAPVRNGPTGGAYSVNA